MANDMTKEKRRKNMGVSANALRKPEGSRKGFPSRGFTLMVTITGALVVMLLFLASFAFAQTQDCTDICRGNVLFTDGQYNAVSGQCVYHSKHTCQYGCGYDICNEFPDEPPSNPNEYSRSMWAMQKKAYDSRVNGADVHFFGTEYMPGENGTLFLQLTDSNSNPIDDGYCLVDVYYPNETAPKLMDNYPLQFLSDGLYFTDFFVPDDPNTALGIYMMNAYCYYAEEYYRFDVPYNVVYDGSLGSGSTNSTYNLEYTDCAMIDVSGANYMYYYFNDSLIGNINISTITSIDIVIVGANSKDSNFRVWNFDTSSWDDKATRAANSITGGCFDVRAKGFSLTTGLNHYVSGNEIRFGSLLTSNGKIVTDNVFVVFHNNGSVINDIRGAGEIHVSDIPFETYMDFATLPDHLPVLLSNHDYCIDNQTLGKTLTWELCRDGKCDNVSRNETIVCNYGCYSNACNPAPFDRTLFLILLFVVIIIAAIGVAFAYERFT